MPFFIPTRLVELEYTEEEPGEVISEFAEERDFAFFVVNFNYSRSDYEELTQKDKAFIRKAYENKVVKETTDMRNAVQNAISNAFRKKNSKPIPLWKKVQKKLDKEKAEDDLLIVEEIEEIEGKTWVDLVYAINGMRRPEKEVTNG